MFAQDHRWRPDPFMERGRQKGDRKKEHVYGANNIPSEPYRKTVLLLGPRGSGKTSLVNSFANFINNVTDRSPYRLHITPVNDKAKPASSMNYARTLTVNSYVFQHSPLGFSVAVVDTPSLGLSLEDTTQLTSPALAQILAWIDNDYTRPIEDLEIWLVISAGCLGMSFEAADELQRILDTVQWKVRVIPVVTFAKRRKPVLALKTLSLAGFQCEHEGVDYFTVNNGSVLGLSPELLEVNALTFAESLQHIKELLLTSREPPEQGELMQLRISTSSPDKLCTLDRSMLKDHSPSLSPPSSNGDSVLSKSPDSLPDEPPTPAPDLPSTPLRAPPPAHSRMSSLDSGLSDSSPKAAHSRRRSSDSALKALDKKEKKVVAAAPQHLRRQSHDAATLVKREPKGQPPPAPHHQRMHSHDSNMNKKPSKPPAYEFLKHNSLFNLTSRLYHSQFPDPPVHRRGVSEEKQESRRKLGIVSISPYETLV